MTSADRAAVRRHIEDKLPLPWPTARDLLAELAQLEGTLRLMRAEKEALADRMAGLVAALQAAARSFEQTRATWQRMETESQRVRRQAQRIYDAIGRFLSAAVACADVMYPAGHGQAALGTAPPARDLEEQADALEALAERSERTMAMLNRATGPHFLDDACLRCSRLFADGEQARVVRGGPAAKYREVGLAICAQCVAPPDFDVLHALTIYRRDAPTSAPRTWPRYVGGPGVTGFAQLSRLENGVVRIGLHRGHVEVWTAEEMRTIGAASGPTMAYSRDYALYGAAELFSDGYRVVERRFVDLAHPDPLKASE